MRFLKGKEDMIMTKNKKTLQNRDIIEKQKDDFVFVDPIYRLWFKDEYCG